MCVKSGGVLTAKQAPHRPGTAPALGLRAGRAVVILTQTITVKETTHVIPLDPDHPAVCPPTPRGPCAPPPSRVPPAA